MNLISKENIVIRLMENTDRDMNKIIGSMAVELIGEYLKAEFGVKLVCVDPATDNPRAIRF